MKASGDSATKTGFGSKIGKFCYDVLVAHFPWILSSAIALSGVYGWQVAEGNAPSPKEILRQTQSLGSNIDLRSDIRSRVLASSDNSSTGNLGKAILPEVQRRVSNPPPSIQEVEIWYELRNRKHSGSRTSVEMGWSIEIGNRLEKCGPVEILYSKQTSLVDKIAERINNSIAISEKRGVISCA